MSPRTCVCGARCFDVSLPVNLHKGLRVWFCRHCRLSFEEADGPVSEEQYLRLLEGECSCHVVLRPVCLLWGGCDRHRSGHQCECPRSPGAPCPHQRAAAHGLSIEEWAGRLRRHRRYPRGDGEDYADRPPPSVGWPARTRQARVSLLAARQALGVSLWHEDDQVGDDTMGEGRGQGLLCSLLALLAGRQRGP